MMNQAIFLDRDGVLIEDTGYPYQLKDLKLNLKLIPYLKKFQDLGYLLIIITNQSGLARGIFRFSDYYKFHHALLHQLLQKGINIHDTFFCPYHPEAKLSYLRLKSFDRKPQPGLILKACHKYKIDLAKSFMIGDKQTDIIKLNQLRSFMIQGNYASGDEETKSFEEILKVVR